MQTISDLKLKVKGLFLENSTFATFTERRDYFINNKAEVLAILETMTAKELKGYYYSRSDDKKEHSVNAVYDAFVSYFLMDGGIQYSPFDGETYAGALAKNFASQTEEQYNTYKAEKLAEKKALLKAIDSPETLNEFRTFIQYKGEDKLTSEQKAIYDNLRADTNKEHKQRTETREATIQAVNISVSMELHDSKHTKTGGPLYVVTLGSRVERDKYTELNTKAKKLGGYYSSYNKGGAIAGFTFKDRKGAELFMDLKEGNVNASELKEEQRQARTLTKAEVLKERAQIIEDKANEELSRERKANTNKRARQAASAEATAFSNIEFAKTLRAIAEGIESGTVKYLSGLTSATELNDLDTILYMAKHEHVRKESLKSDEYEYSIKTAEFCKYPFPTLYKSNVLRLLENLRNDKGKKLASNRMIKRLNYHKDIEYIIIKGEFVMDDYKTLFCYPSPSISTWEIKSYKERILKYDRIQRIGINSIEELRAAIRELITIKSGAKPSPELLKAQAIKEAERKYLGAKMNGFFPTPSDLARKIVESAGIEEGHTILEPSAGLGHIAEAIAELHPENKLICNEYHTGLTEVLKMKGFEVINEDFLTLNGGIYYDRIVMNPPFENLQDVDHVKHAFGLLKPGGRLVSIVANNKRGDRAKCVEFMELVDKYGTIEENESGAFESAFNPTGVSTCTVTLYKP